MGEQINKENFKAWIFWFIDSIKNYAKNCSNQTSFSKVALTASKKSSRAAEITINNSSLVLKYCMFVIVQFPLSDYIHFSIRCIKIGKFGLKATVLSNNSFIFTQRYKYAADLPPLRKKK